MMGRHLDLLGGWPAWARIRRAVALASALTTCAAAQIAWAAGPRAVGDEPIASRVEPDDEQERQGFDDAEREPPPLLSEREVDGGIDIRLHRMRESQDRRAQRWREGAADATGDAAPRLPQRPPARAGVRELDDSAE